MSELEIALDFIVYPLILMGSVLFIWNLINAPVRLAKECKSEIETLKSQLEPFINPKEPSLDDIRDGLTGSIKNMFETYMANYEGQRLSEAEALETAMKYIEQTSAGKLQIREIQRKYRRNKL